MDPTRVLVVYYSHGGTTRKVARAIGKELDCELEAISERNPRRGVLGYLQSGLDATFNREAALAPMSTDARDYDLVVVGTPTWNASVSTPVRTYLTANRGRIRAVAFFCTYEGSGSARVLRQMEEICGRAPAMTLALRKDEVSHDGFPVKVRTFAKALHTGVIGPRTTHPPPLLVVPA